MSWCKEKPAICVNILKDTVKQLKEAVDSESVLFSLEDFMNLEFKCWLCVCEHEYLKLLCSFETSQIRNVENQHEYYQAIH